MDGNTDDRTVVGAAANAASEEIDRLPVGMRLGEFEVTGLVGEGGFSIVYRAWDHSLEREVALKEYMPSALASRRSGSRVHARSGRHQETFDAGLKSFVNEGKLLARFDHPALVKVYRFWEANGTAYMVMPLYEGITLKDTVRSLRQPPSEAWLVDFLGPLTEALSVLHQAQCFHRDIAPDNILLLAKQGDPLLLDFGAARRVIGDKTQALTVILKPGYAPVEQYAEDTAMKQGPWTDVYALAAVVHWAITGRTPPVSVGRMLTDGYVPLVQCAAGRYSERFLGAIDRALAVLPERRTRSIDEFRDGLGLDGAALPTRREAPPPVDSEQTVIHLPSATTAGRRTPPETPLPAEPPRARFRASRLAVGASAAALAAAAIGIWILREPAPATRVALPSPATPAPPMPATVAAPPAREASPTPGEPTASQGDPPTPSAIAVLESTFRGRDPSFGVVASARLPERRTSGAQVRLTYSASEAGYPYLFAADEVSARLTLLHPAPSATARKAAAKGNLDIPASAWPAGGTRALFILAREPRNLASAGWQVGAGGRSLAVGAQAADQGASDAWGVPTCRPGMNVCDAAYGAAYVQVVEESASVAMPPTPSSTSIGPKQPVPRTSKQTALAGEGSSECARILQRVSLGESTPALIEQMKHLRCR